MAQHSAGLGPGEENFSRTEGGAHLPQGTYLRVQGRGRLLRSVWKLPWPVPSFLGEPVNVLGPLLVLLTISIIQGAGRWLEGADPGDGKGLGWGMH